MLKCDNSDEELRGQFMCARNTQGSNSTAGGGRRPFRISRFMLMALVAGYGVMIPAMRVAKGATVGAIVPNSSFEVAAGGEPAQWSIDDATQGTFAWDTTVAHTGRASARIRGSTGQSNAVPAFYVTPSITIIPGAAYTATVWARGQNATGGTRIALSWWSGSNVWLGQAESAWLPSGTTRWTKLIVRTIAPASAAHVQIHLKSSYNSGTVWFDDVTFTGGAPTATSAPPLATAAATSTPPSLPLTATNAPSHVLRRREPHSPFTSGAPTATSAPMPPSLPPTATSTPMSLFLPPPSATSTPPPPSATSTPPPPSATSTPPPPSATSTPMPPSLPPAATSTPGAIALGAYIHDDNNYASSDPSVQDWYANLVGRQPAISAWGTDWVHFNYFQPSTMDTFRTRGSMNLFTWMPGDKSIANGVAQPAYKLTNITRGDFDGYIRQWATDARTWGHPFYLRFGHEMNGNWYAWSTAPGNPDGNTPADFVAAWRHVHDIFTQVGATNVRWVWCVNTTDPSYTPYAQDYPGDNYVDWVSIDGYNWGTSHAWSKWQSLSDVFAASYAELTALTSKPIIIGEAASLEQGGSKADWITQGFLQTIPNSFPNIRAVVWYDDNDANGDWLIESSSASLDAWKSVVASPLYQGQLH